MKFNNEKTRIGYGKLTKHMIEVLQLACFYMKAKYNYTLTVTDTSRTQEEQDNIYKNDENYKKKKWYSVHQFGRGVDISVKNMTDFIIKDLLDTLNRIKYSDKYKTALCHDVGCGKHIHIQVPSNRQLPRIV